MTPLLRPWGQKNAPSLSFPPAAGMESTGLPRGQATMPGSSVWETDETRGGSEDFLALYFAKTFTLDFHQSVRK